MGKIFESFVKFTSEGRDCASAQVVPFGARLLSSVRPKEFDRWVLIGDGHGIRRPEWHRA